MSEPLSVEELKQHLDILRTDQDAMLASMIQAGREWVEKYTGLLFADLEQTPASFNAAIVVHAGSYYESRSITPEAEAACEALCRPYRVNLVV